MANTEELKNAIQNLIEQRALENKDAVTDPTEKDKQNLKKFVLNTLEPDFCKIINNNLVIGEITVSGFMHKKFHLGISKKVTEAFSKFSLIRFRFQNHQNLFSFNSIRCLFIVPANDNEIFLDHIGWRKHLFSLGVMSPELISISKELKDEIESILKKASNERKKSFSNAKNQTS
jgi:hypothetical protein